MRGWYELRSDSDPRFNKLGKDFVCPYRGSLNFDRFKHIAKICMKYGLTEPPPDIKFFIFWEGEEEHAKP